MTEHVRVWGKWICILLLHYRVHWRLVFGGSGGGRDIGDDGGGCGVCVCVYEWDRSTSGVVPRGLSALDFETGSLTALDFFKQTRLAGVSPSYSSDSKSPALALQMNPTVSVSTSLCRLWDKAWVLMLTKQAFYQLSRFPSLGVSLVKSIKFLGLARVQLVSSALSPVSHSISEAVFM